MMCVGSIFAGIGDFGVLRHLKARPRERPTKGHNTMFRQLMGWMGRGRQDAWQDKRLRSWAADQGWEVRSANPGQSLVLESVAGSPRTRLEWGPTQRFYIGGPELRMRAELPSTWTAQLVIMNRSLRRQLEREVFEEFVEDVQTRVDTSTPPEMRLLVMLPKVVNPQSSETSDLSVLATDPDRADQAMSGTLGQVLADWGALDEVLGPLSEPVKTAPDDNDRPFVVLMSGRKLTWRTRLDDLSLERLQKAQLYFEQLRLALST